MHFVGCNFPVESLSNAQYYVVVYANDHEATKQPIFTWTNDDSLLTHTRSNATKRLTDI